MKSHREFKCNTVAQKISEGRIVGWFQDRDRIWG